jgi:hypothetical protein
MMARGAISVQITGDYNNRDVKRAINDLQLLDRQGTATSGAMARMSGFAAGMGAAVGTAAIQAAAAGARMALEFGVNGVQAFMQDEAAAAKLARTMKNLGLEQATASVEVMIDSLQRMTGQADDILRPAFDRLVRSTGDVASANKNLQLALDISAGTGKSLEAVVSSLGRGFDGSTLGLSRLGAGLDKATLKTGDMDLITAKLAETFSGQAATAANTYQGQLDRVQIAISELQESFGRGFLAGVTKGFNDSENAGDSLATAIKNLEPTFYELGLAIGGAAQYIPQIVSGFKLIINGATIVREAMFLAVKSFIALDQVGRLDFSGALKTLSDGADRVKLSFDAAYAAAEELFNGGVNQNQVVINAEAARDALKGQQYAATLTGNATEEAAKQVKDYGSSAASAAKDVVVLTEKQKAMAAAISSAQTVVKGAIDDFNAYKTKIAEGVFAGFDFSAALDVVKEKGTNLVDVLVAQAERASEFGRKMSQLLAAGLNRTSYDQVIAMGAERGTDVADAFINGNIQENIKRVNDAASGAIAVADGVGAQSAMAFMQSGIDMALALVNGLLAALGTKGKGRKALQAMMDDLAASMHRTANISMTVAGPGGASSTSETPNPAPSPINDYLSGVIGIPEGGLNFTGGVPGFANGGPVMGGRPIIVGEKGPELFVPGSNGNIIPNGAGGNSYTINVSAGVGDPRAIGQQIVEYIKRFEQASGPAFVAA